MHIEYGCLVPDKFLSDINYSYHMHKVENIILGLIIFFHSTSLDFFITCAKVKK